MTTENRGVFFDRKHYVHMFGEIRRNKQAELEKLKEKRLECDRSVGDVCDITQNDVDLVDVRRRQILEEDMDRIDVVLTKLNKGWDGTCVDCANNGLTTSVANRLDQGIPTCRCSSCRGMREMKARLHGAPLGLVHYY